MTNVVKKALATAVLVGAAGATQAQTCQPPGCGVGAGNNAPVASATALDQSEHNDKSKTFALSGGGAVAPLAAPGGACMATEASGSAGHVGLFGLAGYSWSNGKTIVRPAVRGDVRSDKNKDGISQDAYDACENMARVAAAKDVCDIARKTWLAAQGEESKAVSYAAAIAACPDLKKAHDSVKGAFSACAAKGAGYKLNMLGECVAPVVPTPPAPAPVSGAETAGRVAAPAPVVGPVPSGHGG